MAAEPKEQTQLALEALKTQATTAQVEGQKLQQQIKDQLEKATTPPG